MSRSGTLFAALFLAAGLGCIKPTPPVVFHTLHPIRQEAAAPRSGLAVEVLPVRLPEVLQRPQMVMAQGPARLTLSETHRWGNPLDRDMQRVLIENLALLLGSDAVVASPYGERVRAAYRLELEVMSCDARAGAGLRLQATWMLTRPGQSQAILVRRTTLQEPRPTADPDTLAEAHSAILAALSREIAAALRTLALKRP